MNINEQMALSAQTIRDRMAAGEEVSRADRKFLQSYLNIQTGKAPNAGRRKTSPRKQRP